MIKESELKEFLPEIQCRGGESITLEEVRQRLGTHAEKHGLKIALSTEQIKTGGMLNSKTDNCLVMYNPEHVKDYFHFCIRIRQKGSCSYILVEQFGQSKQMDKAYRREIAKQGVKDYFRAGAEDYQAIGRSIGAAIGGALGSIGKSKSKLEEEKVYYQMIGELVEEVFC